MTSRNPNKLESLTIAALEEADDQITAAELAKRLGMTDDYALRNAVRDLAKIGKIARHHHPDGILRYSAVMAPSLKSDAAGKTSPALSASVAKAGTSCADLIMEVLAKHGSMRVADLNIALAGRVKKQMVSYNLTKLAKEWKVERSGQGLSALVWLPGHRDAASAELDAPAPDKPARRVAGRQGSKQHRRDFLAAAENSEKVLKALEFNARTTQDSLDVYLHSIGDPSILNALLGARDQARTAVSAYVAGGMTS